MRKFVLVSLVLGFFAVSYAQTVPTGALDIIGATAFDDIRDVLLQILAFAAAAGLILLGAVVGVSRGWKFIKRFF